MTGAALTSKNLVAFAERVGGHLEWSSHYLDLIAVTVGAVFQASGVNEADGVIAVDEESVVREIQALYALSGEPGRSEPTIRTYGATWGRLARIAREWTAAQVGGDEEAFWANIGRLRDNRGRRRTKPQPDLDAQMEGILQQYEYLRKRIGSRSGAGNEISLGRMLAGAEVPGTPMGAPSGSEGTSPDSGQAGEPQGHTAFVQLRDGLATLELPGPLVHEDALTLIQAILRLAH